MGTTSVLRRLVRRWERQRRAQLTTTSLITTANSAAIIRIRRATSLTKKVFPIKLTAFSGSRLKPRLRRGTLPSQLHPEVCSPNRDMRFPSVAAVGQAAPGADSPAAIVINFFALLNTAADRFCPSIDLNQRVALGHFRCDAIWPYVQFDSPNDQKWAHD